jgi:hypothetical protein
MDRFGNPSRPPPSTRIEMAMVSSEDAKLQRQPSGVDAAERTPNSREGSSKSRKGTVADQRWRSAPPHPMSASWAADADADGPEMAQLNVKVCPSP